jgi:hypothetical protein
MMVESFADNLSVAVRYALETTHATAECPFHMGVVIRVGDDAAESHAYERAKRIVKSDGTTWSKGARLHVRLSLKLTNLFDRPH